MAVAFRCHRHPLWHDKPLILASQSPRRLALCEKIGVTPDLICPADIDETPHNGEKPKEYAERMARQKALTVQKHYPEHFILAADTVVCCGKMILDKAEDRLSAETYLEKLSGRKHTVLGGICLICPDGTLYYRLSTSSVRMKRLSMQEKKAYLASGEWQGKAGGYAIQGQAEQLIHSIKGSYANIVGLDVFVLSGMLAAAGFSHDIPE